MKTLNDHQATMVYLLSQETAIPTSAIRLAHALHDVLAHLNNTNVAPVAHTERRIDATTPGLNDAMLAHDIAAVKPKQQSLESLLKQRDNTIRQLKGRVADLVRERDVARAALLGPDHELDCVYDQAGCRKEDTESSDMNQNKLESLIATTRDVAKRSSKETDRRLADFVAKGDAGYDLEIQGATSEERRQSLYDILNSQKNGEQ